jgi:hypothetical protein
MSGAGPPLARRFHQALSGKADHLAQETGVGPFSMSARRFIISSVISGSSVALSVATRSYRGITDDHRKRALVEGALREWLASAQLHHQLGHDPDSGTTREIDLQSVFEPVPGATIFRMKNQARSIIALLSRLNRNRECVLGAGVLE